MSKSGININLDLDTVKLDKLHKDAVINDGVKIQKTTSSDVTKNYNAGETNKYGGVSSSETETMDLSSSVDDTNKTTTGISTNTSSDLNPQSSNVSEVSSANKETMSADVSTSSNTNNSASDVNSMDSHTANNSNLNSSSSTNDLGIDNISSNSKTSKENKDLDIKNEKNKPSINNSSNLTSTGNSTSNTNTNSSQSNTQNNSTKDLGSSFDMGESLESEAVGDSSVGESITLTSVDAQGKEVAIEVSVDEYTNLLESFGIIKDDINRVLNSEITIEELMEEIQSDTDNTRREKMLYATNLQAYGLGYTDIKELEKEIKTQKQKLKELYNQRLKADNHEIDAIANFIYRLQNGENLESILTSQIVAWEYIDEKGNKKYRYDDPYAIGSTLIDGVTYTPYTFEEMYKDSNILKELKAQLTEQTYKPLFSKEEKTVHVWDGSAEQQAYFDKLLENYDNNYDDREESVNKLDAEINELEEKVNIYDSIYNAIVDEVNYYLYNVDAYLHKEDFDKKDNFNRDALKTIDKFEKANENIYIAPDSPVLPAIYITNKEDLVNILSCLINGEGNISNGYLKAGQNYFHLSSTDNILGDYLKYLPYIDEDTKSVFNYIYNTEGVDKAYDFLNGEVYDELDKKWLSENTLINEDFAREHPVVSSVGSVVVTPFEGFSAFYHSVSSYLTNQKIRRADVFSAGDVWRSTVAQDIAKNSEVLSFIYSTGMSMADSVALIGLTAATGGVGSLAISAATMGSRAYVSTLNEALDRGLSDGEAVALSFTSAVVETAMEHFSVSHLLNLEEKLGEEVINLTSKIANKIENKAVANIITKGFYVGASALSQGLVEGEEESATELLNYVADIFISKDLSNYAQSLESYMANGDDETTAWVKTMRDFTLQASQAFLGGFVSGVCFGTFGGAKTVQRSSYAIANDMYGKLNGKSKAQKFAQVLEINKSQLQEFNDIVDKKQRGETLTEAEEHFFKHGTIEMQIAQNMKDARAAKIRGLIKSIREITQTKGINTGVALDVNEIDDFNDAAKDFAEGNKALENLLLTSHKYNVDTLACCGGHIGYTKLNSNTKYNQPYIAFKMTEEFEKCLPTIMEVMGNNNFDIAFIKSTIDSGYNSFVTFKQNNYSDEMFNTLNRVIENVMSNETIITNVSENTSKMMEIYNYLKNNELSTSVQVEISKNISGVNSEINYEMYYGSTYDKGSFDAKNFVEGISKVEDTIKSIGVKESVEQLEAEVEELKIDDNNTSTESIIDEGKLTLPQFQEQISKLKRLTQEYYDYGNKHYKDVGFDGGAYDEQYHDKYCEVQNQLLSSDLSDIPFEAWNGVTLMGDVNHPLDLSKTHANLDFNLIKVRIYSNDTNNNFRSCKIKNFEKIKEFSFYNFDENTFDREVMEQNPQYFLLGNFPKDFRDRFYASNRGTVFGKKFSLEEIANLSAEQINEFQEKVGFEDMMDHKDRKLIEIFGLQKCLELCQYSEDVYYDMRNIITRSFLVYNPSDDIDVDSFINMINKCGTIQEIKQVTYDFLREYIIEHIDHIREKDYSKEFVKCNSDLFLIGTDIPINVKNDYFSKKLSMQDVIRYYDTFKSLPIEYFVQSPSLKEYAKTLGYGKLGEFLMEHRLIINDILSWPKSPKLYRTEEDYARIFLDYIDNVDAEKVTPINVNVYVNGEGYVSIISALKRFLTNQETIEFLAKYKYNIGDFEKNAGTIKLEQNFTKDDLLNSLEPAIFEAIIKDAKTYAPYATSYFKELHPDLFLSESVDSEIQEKFYNKKLSTKDFESNPELLQIFDNTNVAYGFSPESTWITSLFSDVENPVEANSYRLRVLKAYESIRDSELKQIFNDFFKENASTIPVERIEYIAPLLNKVSYSNSSELRRLKSEVVSQILLSDNPIKTYEKIERIFVKSNLPTVGKIYLCFKTLYENYKGLDFGELSSMSPVLKSKSLRGKDTTIFADLIKANFGSNNRAVREYLTNIEVAYDLYSKIKNGEITFESLDRESRNELTTFRNHLQTLYEQTLVGRVGKEGFNSTENVVEDINVLSTLLAPNGNTEYYLPDRVVSMFSHFAGFDTLEEVKNYMDNRVAEAEARNIKRAESDLVLEVGDYVKGIDPQYLANILQRGSVAKEYLGDDATSDATPLDTDLSRITALRSSIYETIIKASAKKYGPIKLILKNDDRFSVTRTKDGGDNLDAYDATKLEAFYTGVDDSDNSEHYGIRTGFASTDIDYIMTDVADPSIGFEIARNGFYIPVVDKDGKIIFTPDDYKELRLKMQGLSYYDTAEYTLSDSLISKDVMDISKQIKQSREEVIYKRDKINQVLSKALSDNNLTLKTTIDGDLSEGSVELLDTGSTGRFTNKPGDGDFDFMMRVDRSVFFDSERMDKLKQSILQSLGIENNEGVIASGDFRLKGVKIDDITVDIDITFVPKSDKLSYSTDASLQDRLNNILEQHPEQYKYVISNILLAKQVLKDGGVYKPNRGDVPQGGLGGVGVENWVLQHGGSFVEAAESFVEAAKEKTFEKFKEVYQIWDFGENHMAEKKGINPHDEFISNNMTAEGYTKMVKVLQEYLDGYYASNQNLVEDKLVSALNAGEGSTDIVVEIKNYTEENLPEGYSSLKEFNERLADKLIETGTLDKLDNRELAAILKSKDFLRKIIDSNKLSYFLSNNLGLFTGRIFDLFDGLTNEELVRIFDKPAILEYFNSLTDEQFINICNEIGKRNGEMLISSSNFRNRIAKLDPGNFIRFEKESYYLIEPLINDRKNGGKFIEILTESFGKEEIILNFPTLVKTMRDLIPYAIDGDYAYYGKYFEEIDNNIHKKLCTNLITNAECSLPEDAIIKGNGFYTIKYSIDGVEYEHKTVGEVSGKLDILKELKDHQEDILAGKLKIISVAEDTIRNALTLKDSSKIGLNVVTLKINGEIEKHLVEYSSNGASLTDLMKERQIDSVELISVEPFSKSSFDMEEVDNDSTYKMTYKIDGEVYTRYFLPNKSSLNVGSYIIKNNLYNATDISIEAIKLDVVSKDKFKVTSYRNSEYLFNESTYGGAQADVRDIVVKALANEELSNIDKQKSELLISLVTKYYPAATSTDIKNIVSAYTEDGCAYMAVANSFITYMNSLENGENIFKDKMGFDLMVTDGSNKSLNVEAVALDYYLYTHKFTKGYEDINSLLKNSEGVSLENYIENVTNYFKSKNILIECNGMNLDKKRYTAEILVNALNNNGFFLIGSGGFDLERMGTSVIDRSDAALANAQMEGNYLKNVNGHTMLITDILDNGDIIVSSWKGKYKFVVTDQTDHVTLYNINFNVNDANTNLVENRLVSAINSNTGVDELIDEINNYSENNLPEGYSSLTNFKERIADILIKTGTIDKLDNQQFSLLIKDKTILKKVLDTEKLSYLIRKNLTYIPKRIINLFDGLSNEELIKVFDRTDIKEYLDTLTDEEFLKTIAIICKSDSNLLIISENFKERIAKTDPKLFNNFLTNIYYNLSTILNNDIENGTKFVDMLIETFGKEEIMLANPTLANNLLNALPYGTNYKSYRKVVENLNTIVNKHLCDILVKNSKVPIPEDGMINEKGYFTIKYSIDGTSYEYRNIVRVTNQLNLLEALSDHYDDILAGKLQVESITADNVKNALFIEDKTKHGLNVVTLEINGKIEKHIIQFSSGEASLLSLMNEKQIDSAKVISIEPFIGETFNIDGDKETLAKGYKMTYKKDGKIYEHCFLPVIKSWASGVYIDPYIVKNNLYDATDIKIEPIQIDGYKEHNLDINRFKNSEEVFSDDVYGGYQGNVREIILKTLNGENLTAIEKQKSDLLIGLIKKYYPAATSTDIKNIAKTCAAAGCGYMATANSFVTYMNSLVNGAQIFKDKMGFDLYLTDGTTKSFNLEAIALDYYLYANKIGRGFDTISTLLSKETGMNFQYADLVKYYFESKGIKVTASSIDTSIDTYKNNFLIESMNEGEIITIGSEGFDLEKIVGETNVSGDAALEGAISTDNYKTNVGGHDMLVTDMLENGDLIVSSWSGKYRFIPTDKTKYINIVTIKFDIEDSIKTANSESNKLISYKINGKEYNLPNAVKDILIDYTKDRSLDLEECKYIVKDAQKLHQKLEEFLEVLSEYFKNLTSEYNKEEDVLEIIDYVDEYSAHQKKSAEYGDYISSNEMIIELLLSLLDGIEKYQQVVSINNYFVNNVIEGRSLQNSLDIAKMFKDPKGYLFTKLFEINNKNINDVEVRNLAVICSNNPVYRLDVNELYKVLYKYLTPEEQIEVDKLLADPLMVDKRYTQEEKDVIAVYTGNLGPYIGAILRRSTTNFRGVKLEGNYINIKDMTNSFKKMKINDCENYDTSFDGMIKTLDTIISKSSPLRESIIVTRAADGIFINGDKVSINDIEPGTIFTDDSYISTTLKSMGGILAFNDRDVFMEITLPEGTKGAYLESFSGVSGYGQQEFLLPRGSRFEVTDYPIYKDGHFIVKVRLILDE